MLEHHSDFRQNCLNRWPFTEWGQQSCYVLYIMTGNVTVGDIKQKDTFLPPVGDLCWMWFTCFYMSHITASHRLTVFLPVFFVLQWEFWELYGRQPGEQGQVWQGTHPSHSAASFKLNKNFESVIKVCLGLTKAQSNASQRFSSS